MERINRTTTGCASCDYYFYSHILDNAKLALAKDYIAKALKLIEEIEQTKDGVEE